MEPRLTPEEIKNFNREPNTPQMARFEKWAGEYTPCTLPLIKNDAGDQYTHVHTQSLWLGWKKQDDLLNVAVVQVGELTLQNLMREREEGEKRKNELLGITTTAELQTEQAIFTLTSVAKTRTALSPINARCFGYFLTLDDALAAVEENTGNMQEGLYDYLVIEETRPGIHAETVNESWFEWKTDDSQSGWVAITKPDLHGDTTVTNFSMG